jgi:hypothetical protein
MWLRWWKKHKKEVIIANKDMTKMDDVTRMMNWTWWRDNYYKQEHIQDEQIGKTKGVGLVAKWKDEFKWGQYCKCVNEGDFIFFWCHGHGLQQILSP